MKSRTNKGKQSTRDTILHTLKSSNQAKVESLAQAANVSPVTVRHHLNALQADGLIEVASVRRKVGRPYYVYSLSEKGHELFPQKYVRLTNRLLDELKARLPIETVNEIFSNIVKSIIREHKGEFENLPFEERLTFLVDLLTEEGFLAKWEKANGKYQLTAYSCPYLSVAYDHAEVCILDKELIVEVMQLPIEHQGCMVNGDDFCQFLFSAGA